MQSLPRTQAGPDEFKANRGSNQSGMRAHNERLVLSLIRQRGPLAKADIARATGLSAQTVSVIMRALEAEGLLVKGDPVRGKVGQPSVPMRLAGDGAYFLGLKVGRRSVELVLIDFLGNVLNRAVRTYPYPTPDAARSFATEMIDTFLAALSPQQRERVAGLGIAMPFFLWNWADHLGVPREEMAAWKETDLRADIAALHDFPVFLNNDASAACGAEVVFGDADRPRNFLYLYVGYFIGGGVVLNGALFSGAGNAGALGPLPVPTARGVRQLIDVASLSGLEARLREAGTDTARMWQDAEGWDHDEGIVADWIAEAAEGLAFAIATSCSVVDFEAVLIDGWLPVRLRDTLVETVKAAFARIDTEGLVPPHIRAGTVGADARALGAASLPLSERFLLDPGGVVGAPSVTAS